MLLNNEKFWAIALWGGVGDPPRGPMIPWRLLLWDVLTNGGNVKDKLYNISVQEMYLSFLDLWYDSHEVHLYSIIAYIY
jgi:hypothetical protein